MTNKDESPYIFIRKKAQITQYKNPHYILLFAKLKEYSAERKLKGNFSDTDFRFLLRDDTSIQESYKSSQIKSFLGFCCMDDIGICQQKFIRQNGGKYERFSVSDLSKYDTFQDYLRKNKLTYIQIVGEPDRRTLEEKLAEDGEVKEAQKEHASESFFQAIKKRFGNT
jgi:hypothetical protein